MNNQPLLKTKQAKKEYVIKKTFEKSKTLKALSEIDIEIFENETLGIVGESGSGKSTLAKILTQLESLSGGDIFLENVNYNKIDKKTFHSKIQMVFQDPYQSLNPRKKAFDIIAAPLRINTSLTEEEISSRVFTMMEKVGLRKEFSERYPHHFSGGQRQRLGIARALMLRPKILILDEPVSALDVSIQAQVLNLLISLQKEFQMTYVFISHDLSVIQHMSDRILVMYLGKIVEYGSREDVFTNPMHPYTKLLLESAPKMGQTNSTVNTNFEDSELPSPLNLPKGCSFYSRCSERMEKCLMSSPELVHSSNRSIACFLSNAEIPEK